MREFYENKDTLNQMLEKFVEALNVVLPKYSGLLKKDDLSMQEVQELGEIEHFLIEINGKITEIKNLLESDLFFGHSIDQYYRIKSKALKGDACAKMRLEMLREAFNESLRGDILLNRN